MQKNFTGVCLVKIEAKAKPSFSEKGQTNAYTIKNDDDDDKKFPQGFAL